MAYKKGGIVYPRCTAIIADCTPKNWGMQWGSNCVVEWIKENVTLHTIYKTPIYLVDNEALDKARFAHNDISKQARNIGSETHNAVEKWLQKKKYELTSRQAGEAFKAFREWKFEVNLKPIYLEQTVWGDRWAGTCDFYGYYKDKLYVIDWKTSKAFYPEMRYQVAAYRSAITKGIESKWNGYDIKMQKYAYGSLLPVGCGILRLDKETGIPEFKDTSKTYESDLGIFNKMLDLYFARHSRIRKRFENKH